MTPTQVARELVKRLEAGDAEGAAALFAEDSVTWRNVDGRDLTKRQVRKVLAFLAAEVRELRYDDVRIQTTKQGFVQQHVLRCKAPNGQAVVVPTCLVVRVRGGQIVRIDEYADSAAMAPLMG